MLVRDFAKGRGEVVAWWRGGGALSTCSLRDYRKIGEGSGQKLENCILALIYDIYN